jgi:hypothetical protein
VKEMFLYLALLSLLGDANNANATTELMEGINVYPILSCSTFVRCEEISCLSGACKDGSNVL